VISSIDDLNAIANIIDSIDDKLAVLKDMLFDKEINVYIGQNNPVFKNRHLAFIGTKSNKDKLLIAIITPKVTAYEKHFKLFYQLIKTF
jgi:transcriptional regulator of heat shock response